MTQRISENSGHVHEAGEHADAGGADEDADEGGDDREPHRDDRAEGDQQHDDRDADADAARCSAPLRQQGEAPVSSVCTPAARAASATAMASSSCVVVELVERVGDVDVGGLPVGAERRGLGRERVGDAGDVVPVGELLRGPARRSTGGSASSSRPSSVWSTMRADRPPWLGNRSFRTSAACWDSTPGHAVAVVELAAGAALQRHDGDGGHQPEARAPGTGAGRCCGRGGTGMRSRGSSWFPPAEVRDKAQVPGER